MSIRYSSLGSCHRSVCNVHLLARIQVFNVPVTAWPRAFVYVFVYKVWDRHRNVVSCCCDETMCVCERSIEFWDRNVSCF